VVDRNIILARVTTIRESVRRLVALAALSERAFRADADACAIAERHLQVAIQSVIDIGNHVVADLDLGTATDYKEIFVLLAKHRIISKALAEKLGPWPACGTCWCTTTSRSIAVWSMTPSDTTWATSNGSSAP